MQKSEFRDKIDLHGVNNLVHLLVKNLHALEFNTLEQRIPRHAVLNTVGYAGETK